MSTLKCRIFCRTPLQTRTIALNSIVFILHFMLKKLSPFLIAFALGAAAYWALRHFIFFRNSYHRNRRIMLFMAKNRHASKPHGYWASAMVLAYIASAFIGFISACTISAACLGGSQAFATFCLCAFMALFVALVGYFSKKLRENQAFLLISIPVLWGLSDWIRSWIFTGFPWLTMGYTQVPHSPLAGYMPIVGVYGVSVITVFLAF